MAVDGYLNFNTKIDTKGFESGTDRIASKTKITANEVSKTVSQSNAKIQEILDDTERSYKSKAASIAAIYRKEGMDTSEAMTKAWSVIERGSAGATGKIQKSANKITSSVLDDTKKIKNSLSGIRPLLSKLAVAASAMFSTYALVNFGKEAINLASDIKEVQNVVDVAFGQQLKGQMEDFAASSIQTYGISKLVAKQTGSTYMAMAKGMQIADANAAEMALTLTGLSADMASFYNKEQSVTATALNSVFTGETETLKQFGIVMTEANLQQFAYTQGINKKISAMSQAEKVQLRYNYVMQQTSLAQGDFTRTQNSWANQTRILSEMWKEFAGTVGTILMNTLLPAVQSLNKAMTWLNAVAQSVLETLSSVFGWDVEANNATAVSDAIGTAVDNQNALTDAVNETAEAQERQLMGFDKINKLNDDSSSGSSGAPAAAGGANEIPVDIDTTKAEKKLTDFQKMLKDFVSSLKITFNDVFFDWKDLTGEQIAEKIIASLGAIAGGIIGFSIGGVPGAVVGATLGVALSLVMSSLTFNHDGKLGGEEILSLITTALMSVAGGIIGFSVGGVTGAAVGVTIGAVLSFIINELTFNTDGELSGEEIAKYVITALGAVAGGLIGFSTDGVVGAAVGIAIGTSISFGIADMSFDGDGKLNADEIIGMIVTALSGIAGGVIGFVVGGPAGAVVGASLGIGLSVFINQMDWGALWLDVSTGFTNILENIKTWLSDKKVELKTAWEDHTSVVKDKTAKMKATVTGKLDDFKKSWKKRADLVKSKTAKMKATVATKIDDFKKSWNNRAKLVKDKTAKMKLSFAEKVADIKSEAKKRFNAITEVFSYIPTWFSETFSDAWQKVKDVFSSGGKVFEGIKDGILSGLKTVINALIDGINWVIAIPFNGINTALEKIKNVSIAGKKPFYEKISTINVPQIPKLATGTVVPANYGEFLAILGDNKREVEVVSPLSTIKKDVAEVMGSGGEQNINLVVELDGEVVYRTVVKNNRKNTKMTGVNELATA